MVLWILPTSYCLNKKMLIVVIYFKIRYWTKFKKCKNINVFGMYNPFSIISLFNTLQYHSAIVDDCIMNTKREYIKYFYIYNIIIVETSLVVIWTHKYKGARSIYMRILIKVLFNIVIIKELLMITIMRRRRRIANGVQFSSRNATTV